MNRRSLYLIAAFGLLASLGYTAPSHAGPMYQTTAIFLNSTGQAASDFHATFTGTGGTISSVVATATATTVTSSISGGGNTIDLTFSPNVANGAILSLTFNTDFSPIGLASAQWTFPTGAPIATTAVLISTLPLPAVPEPTSMALMGLGMVFAISLKRFRVRMFA